MKGRGKDGLSRGPQSRDVMRRTDENWSMGRTSMYNRRSRYDQTIALRKGLYLMSQVQLFNFFFFLKKKKSCFHPQFNKWFWKA